jgi:hypothetical protein
VEAGSLVSSSAAANTKPSIKPMRLRASRGFSSNSSLMIGALHARSSPAGMTTPALTLLLSEHMIQQAELARQF